MTQAQAAALAVNTVNNTASNSAPTNEVAPKLDTPTPFTGLNPSSVGLVSRTGQGGPAAALPPAANPTPDVLPSTADSSTADSSLVNSALKDLLAKILMQHSPDSNPVAA
jgi:hypothetical protein